MPKCFLNKRQNAEYSEKWYISLTSFTGRPRQMCSAAAFMRTQLMKSLGEVWKFFLKK